jgi:hypothetical protein
MNEENKNSNKASTKVKNDVLKECLSEFCFSPLETTAGSILSQSQKKTKVVTTKSTFSRHFNAPVHIENHGVLSLHDIRKNEIIPILQRENCVERNAPAFQPLAEKVEKVLQNLFATKHDNIVRQRQENSKNNRLLTVNEEKFLVQLCKFLAHSGYGLSRDQVLSVMNVMAPLPSKKSHSIHALDNFMKRNPDLSVQKSSGIDPLRAEQANSYVRDVYFSKLDAYIRLLHSMGRCRWENFSEIPAKFKYNMDEIGSNTTRHRGAIVGAAEGGDAEDAAAEYRKRLFTITKEGDKMPFHVTMCLTTRSDGQFVFPGGSISDGAPPPVIIHSRKGEQNPADISYNKFTTGLYVLRGTSGYSSMEEAFQRNNKHGVLVLATPDGSMTQSAMLPFAKHFVNHLPKNRRQDEPIILFLDGHSSRWDVPTLNYFFKNNVFPFLLPSHTSIWSQPNDCGPNKRLHECLGEATKAMRSTFTEDQKFDITTWNMVFRQGWDLFLTRERNDWRRQGSNTSSFAYVKTGIEPFNPKPSSWQDAIDTIGVSFTGRHGKYSRSYDVIPSNLAMPHELTALEVAKTIIVHLPTGPNRNRSGSLREKLASECYVDGGMHTKKRSLSSSIKKKH